VYVSLWAPTYTELVISNPALFTFIDRRRARKVANDKLAQEHRLWLSYIGFLLTFCGIVVFVVRVEQATVDQGNITSVIGIGIAAAGNQVVTMALITYAIDFYHEEAATRIGVFISLVRQTWGFIGPFWFPQMFEDVGIAASAGVGTTLLVSVSRIPTAFLWWRGELLRWDIAARL